MSGNPASCAPAWPACDSCASCARAWQAPPSAFSLSPPLTRFAEDTRDFAEHLCAVAVQRCSLAGSPQAALLEAHAAEQRLRGAPAAMAAAKSAVVPAARAQALPPASPDLLAATPRVGCKRPAATPLPQALTTPVVKVGMLGACGATRALR